MNSALGVCMRSQRTRFLAQKARIEVRSYERREQAWAPHANGPRNMPLCEDLSLLQRPLHYKKKKSSPAFVYVSLGPVVIRARA